jgi:hypothetical protein
MLAICTAICLCPNLQNNFRLPGHNIEGGTQAEGVGEQSAEEDIWAYAGLGDRGVEKDYITRNSMTCTSHQIFG